MDQNLFLTEQEILKAYGMWKQNFPQTTRNKIFLWDVWEEIGGQLHPGQRVKSALRLACVQSANAALKAHQQSVHTHTVHCATTHLSSLIHVKPKTRTQPRANSAIEFGDSTYLYGWLGQTATLNVIVSKTLLVSQVPFIAAFLTRLVRTITIQHVWAAFSICLK